MSHTFVLVHGAWVGGWCWRDVAAILRAAGHHVLTPTLTGLGERSHLLHPDIDVELHVTDVVNVIRWEELRGIVVVGHSYGGMVISGVAERLDDGVVASIVYLKTYVFATEGGLLGFAQMYERLRGSVLANGDDAVPARRDARPAGRDGRRLAARHSG